MKHPKWELHEVLGYDNWPTINLSFNILFDTYSHGGTVFWIMRIHADFSWNFGHLHTVILGSGFENNSSLPRFWTLLWRTPEDGGSSGRLFKENGSDCSDWKSFSTSFPNCVSLSLLRENLFTNLTNPTTFKRKMLIWTVQSSDPWGFQTFHRWLQPTERAM